MSIRSIWERRRRERRESGASVATAAIRTRQPIEWEYGGKLHIFAMTHPDNWSIWCMVEPGKGHNIKLPNRGWPTEEATIAPFRTSFITCPACLFMWKLVSKRDAANFLWDPNEDCK